MSINQKTKKLLYILCGIGVMLLNPLTSIASDDEASLDILAKSALAIDLETGKILYEKNSDTPVGIASITKIITAYLVYEAVEKGEISWDTPVPLDDDLMTLLDNWELANIPFDQNLTYTVEDHLNALLISSSNISASALARLISGSEPAFVDDMIEKLNEWNITDATLISASGLNTDLLVEKDQYPDSKADDNNLMSAKDITLVASNLLKDFPEVIDITKQEELVLFSEQDNEVRYNNSNLMLPGYPYETKGVDGLKTGTMPIAGECFMGTMMQGEHRIVTVVLNTDQDANRFEETQKLMQYVENEWTYSQVVSKNEPSIIPTLNVPNGIETEVSLILDRDIMLWTNSTSKIQSKVSDIPDTLTFSKNSDRIESGTLIGTQRIFDETDTLGYLTPNDIPNLEVSIVTKETVEKASFWLKTWRSIQNTWDNISFFNKI